MFVDYHGRTNQPSNNKATHDIKKADSNTHLTNSTLDMKLLNDLLAEHYLPEDKEELVMLLESYDVFSTIEILVSKLRQHLVNQTGEHSKAPLTVIGSLSSSALTSINSKVVQIADPKEKRKVQVGISQLALRLLLTIVRQFPDEAQEIFATVSTSLEDTSEMNGYNIQDIRRLMMLGEIQELFNSINGKKQAAEISQRTPQTLPFLQWTGTVPLDLLTHELHTRKWIKSRKEFEGLFENQDPSFRLHWDFSKKASLAYLLYRLKRERLIAQNGSKGYFSIAEKYIVDFSGQPLTTNALKKLSSKIRIEYERYYIITDEVDAILKKLKRMD